MLIATAERTYFTNDTVSFMSSKKSIDLCSFCRFAAFHLLSMLIGVTVGDWSFSDQSKETGPCARDCEF